MSTRSVIGVWNASNTHWSGVYLHWDGKPKWIGAHLFSEYNRLFKGNLKGMVDFLLSERVGWSVLAGCDFSLEPRWFESLSPDNPNYEQLSKYPRAYSKRHDRPGSELRISDTGDPGWIQWAYIFDVPANTMHIFHRGIKIDKWNWTPAAVIDLDGTEPDWKAIEP
jgi:hypothetical protein